MSSKYPIHTKTFHPIYTLLYNPALRHAPMHSGPNSLLLQNAIREADRVRPREGLWWSMIKVSNTKCPTPVVRNWATRRVRSAFVRALRERGLGVDGLVLRKGTGRGTREAMEDGGNPGSKHVDRHVSGQQDRLMELQGSLALRVELAAAKASSKEVEDEVRGLVQWLCQRGVPAGSAEKDAPNQVEGRNIPLRRIGHI